MNSDREKFFQFLALFSLLLSIFNLYIVTNQRQNTESMELSRERRGIFVTLHCKNRSLSSQMFLLKKLIVPSLTFRM